MSGCCSGKQRQDWKYVIELNDDHYGNKKESKTPWTATHPGTILRYELEDREISQKDFAVMIGMQKSHLNELIKGKRPITKPIADKIEEVLGISAVSLVNMQNPI